MTKSALFFLVFILIATIPSNAQFGRLVNRAVDRAVDDILDGNNNKKTETPEPSCACDQAELILDLGASLKLNYNELDISPREDGALLVKDKISGNYYIVKGGNHEGPIPAGDKRLEGFEVMDDENKDIDLLLNRYSEYIKKSGDKYSINFGGKTYGPYAQISDFFVTMSKTKFGATVVENLIITEDQQKKMEKAIQNAKTDQEKMELSMQYAQLVQQNMMQNGGNGMMPSFITNVPNSNINPVTSGGTFSTKMKYDEIVLVRYDGITNLEGKKLITVKPEHLGNDIFISSDNSKYASYHYGELTFSDNKVMNELFNPHLIKGSDGKIYLAYMYYSPKKNSLMQCKIPF
jgi:hypothetical protein